MTEYSRVTVIAVGGIITAYKRQPAFTAAQMHGIFYGFACVGANAKRVNGFIENTRVIFAVFNLGLPLAAFCMHTVKDITP